MSSAKTIIVDGQMWQTNAYFRGMGGFAFGLLRAFMAASPDTRLLVVLNKHMQCDQERQDGIRSWLPEAQIYLLDLPFEPAPGAEEQRAVATLDAFVQAQTNGEDVYYFIPALFMFQYCAVFPTNVRKLLLFHDLMPLIYRQELGKYFPAHLYFPRFRTIFEADVVLANSQTTANDLLQYLGVDPQRVVTIDGSLNERIAASDAAHQERAIISRLQLNSQPYILLPTGGLENKNNIRAAQAFQMLRRTASPPLKLVVTSFFDDQSQRELRLITDDIIFTNNITNEELSALYANATAVLMPSLYEGLGLPVLEAVAHNKPVACSDVPVFQEIPHFRDALYAFDPYDIEDMAEALLRAVAGAGFAQKREHYPSIMQKYNWERSAGLFADALALPVYGDRKPPKKRIAVTCPDPRKNNDVAVFAQRMYGYGLQHGVEFVYFIDPGGDDEVGATVLADYIRATALCYDVRDIYQKLAQEKFDGVVHFLSGDARFGHALRAALSVPGYVYVGSEGYLPTIEAMAAAQVISPAQFDTEQQLYALAHKKRAFQTPSVLATAKGVIAERHVQKQVQKALDLCGNRAEVLEIPACAVVNFDRNARQNQEDVYRQVIAFISRQS